jgi:predicted RNA binding protein YcfA (HicA-like mRNA interferase family)
LNYTAEIWDQLKSLKPEDLVSALTRDGWARDATCKKEQVYRHPTGKRVSIHYHPGKTYGPKLLKALLADIGWSVAELRRLKLVK